MSIRTLGALRGALFHHVIAMRRSLTSSAENISADISDRAHPGLSGSASDSPPIREIEFAADRNPTIVLGAGIFLIDRIVLAPIEPRHCPRARQGVIVCGDLVAQDVGIILVEVKLSLTTVSLSA